MKTTKPKKDPKVTSAVEPETQTPNPVQPFIPTRPDYWQDVYWGEDRQREMASGYRGRPVGF
jgi:hypothetical protein